MGALRQALARYDREHPPPMVVPSEVFSVRQQFDRLLAILDAGRPYPLLDDLRSRCGRAEAIATFLAVLELARLHLVRIHQTGGGEILLFRTTREVEAAELERIEA
jgi:chromatin segregation and condensation protein Rec8/ScpA/Scc1 (kleisin family)